MNKQTTNYQLLFSLSPTFALLTTLSAAAQSILLRSCRTLARVATRTLISIIIFLVLFTAAAVDVVV